MRLGSVRPSGDARVNHSAHSPAGSTAPRVERFEDCACNARSGGDKAKSPVVPVIAGGFGVRPLATPIPHFSTGNFLATFTKDRSCHRPDRLTTLGDRTTLRTLRRESRLCRSVFITSQLGRGAFIFPAFSLNGLRETLRVLGLYYVAKCSRQNREEVLCRRPWQCVTVRLAHTSFRPRLAAPSAAGFPFLAHSRFAFVAFQQRS